MKEITRKEFLKGAAAFGLSTIVPSSVLGKKDTVPPSERINVGMIGCGNITKHAHSRYINNPKAQLLAVCDPFELKRVKKKNTVDAEYARIKNLTNYKGCLAYNDFRDMLANKDIDAVYISAGDYWHVPMSILAAKAGKDLHTEKPLGLCINECLQMEKAVKKYNRVFQYGTEGRSMIGTRLGIEVVLNGHLGEIQRVYAWAPTGKRGGNFKPAPVPPGFDFNLWLGPAPDAPYSHGRCNIVGANNAIFHHYDYAIGFIAGWGAHPIDIYQWWADNAGLGIPSKIEGTGKIPTEGVYNTLTNWDVTYKYGKGPEVRFLDTTTARTELPKLEEVTFELDRRMNHGVIFIGTEGKMLVKRGSFITDPLELRQRGRNPGPIRLHASIGHEEDWVNRILDRKKPVSDIRSAVCSDIICHLGDIAVRTGRQIKWDDKKKSIVDDEAARAMMCRKYRKPWSIEV
jgi:predicted dehydrogenase